MRGMLRYICPGCERLVTPEAVEAREEGIAIRCPKCGEVETVAPSEPRGETEGSDGDEAAGDETRRVDEPDDEQPEREVAAEAARCPKCGELRGNGDACPRCGLVFDLWDPKEQDGIDPSLQRLWEKVCERWGDRELHGRFVEACLAGGALGYAARSYGSRDDELAREQLRKLTAMAFQAMKSSEEGAGPDPRVGRVVGWGLFVAMCLAILAALLYLFPR